jgi:hypothetical protein
MVRPTPAGTNPRYQSRPPSHPRNRRYTMSGDGGVLSAGAARDEPRRSSDWLTDRPRRVRFGIVLCAWLWAQSRSWVILMIAF